MNDYNENDVTFNTEFYTCECCGKPILDGTYNWAFCSMMCAREFEELGIMAHCG